MRLGAIHIVESRGADGRRYFCGFVDALGWCFCVCPTLVAENQDWLSAFGMCHKCVTGYTARTGPVPYISEGEER